ncbi:MAG: hypothetical protein ABIO67_11295 [Mycobacteriales bacterium]
MTARSATRVLMVGLLALASGLLGSAAGAAEGSPTRIAPGVAAWFDAAYPTAAATPPAAPGVAAGQLVIEGTSVPTLGPGLPGPLSAPVVAEKALTALSFRIPAGTTPASLVLDLAPSGTTAVVGSRAPTGVTPQACPTTATFQAGRRPYDELPAHDCTGRTSYGALSADGKQVVFSDIGGLAVGNRLDVVLRPGTTGADRLVIDLPKAGALSLLPFDVAPALTPAGVPAAAPAQPSASPAIAAGPLPFTAVPRTAVAPGSSLGSPAAPFVETPLTSEVLPTENATVRAAAVVPSTAAARWQALAGLLLLTAVVALLLVTDPRRQSVGFWQVWRAVKRGEPVPAIPPQDWGYGRHRLPRTGPTPTL